MTGTQRAVWWIVGIIIVLGVIYLIWRSGTAGENLTTPSGDTTGAAEDMSAPMTAAVSYDGTAFAPADVTIKRGGSVTFTSTAGNMWIAGAPHPAHTGYDGTDLARHCAAGYTPKSFDQCVAGTSYTFTPDKVGTWPYHDHIKIGAFGRVNVVE